MQAKVPIPVLPITTPIDLRALGRLQLLVTACNGGRERELSVLLETCLGVCEQPSLKWI